MQLVGTSKTIQTLQNKSRNLSSNSEYYTLVGEAGTGKSYFAKYVHGISERKHFPFVVFDAAAATDIEKQLYGFAKQSIIGIEHITSGSIEAAGDGTLVIKNIQLFPFDYQAHLVALLELGGFRPVDSEQTKTSSCRFVICLPKNPDELKEDGKLTEELAHVLQRNLVKIEPLRERSEDIESLAVYFINNWCDNLGIKRRALTKQALKLLKKCRFAGNVAELQFLILKTLVNFKEETIDAKHLELKIEGNWHVHSNEHLEEIALEEIVERKIKQFMERLGKHDIENLHGVIMERVERPLIKLAMERSQNNQLKASRILGINRNTLRAKLQKMEI